LWRRYLVANTLFLLLCARELFYRTPAAVLVYSPQTPQTRP